MFQIPCALLNVRDYDLLRSTVCLKHFVYPVARRHIVLLASLHHIASTAQILVTAWNFRWRMKSRRLGPQISCNFRKLGVVARPSTRSIFHEVSVLKPSNSTSSSSETRQPTRRSVHYQDTLTSLIGDQDKIPQLLKIILTVKPTSDPQSADPSSSSALSSKDHPTSASSSERSPRRTSSPCAKSSSQGSR